MRAVMALPPPPGAPDALIEHAAARAVQRAARLRPIVGYTRDDALQDARIGAWGALAAGGRAGAGADADAGAGEDAGEGGDRRLGLAALAAYRQIIDGRRHRYRTSAGGAREDELDSAPEAAMPAAAPALVAVAQALAAIERLRDPLPRVAAWLIEGEHVVEIARRIGVTPSRVSQMRGELRRVVERFIHMDMEVQA